MNAYAYLVVGAIWVASLAGVGWWQNAAGHTAERVDWQDRENKDLRVANAEIVRLTDRARKAEATHAQAITDISTGYQKELQHANIQRDRDVAAARAGALVLRYDSTGQRADRCPAAAPGASPGGRDGGAPAGLCEQAGGDIQLPKEITASLYALAHDANAIARQLSAAQQVIIEDRRLCSGSPP